MRSPTLMLLPESGVEPMLDDWLDAGGVDTFDKQIEIPAEFEEQYRDRCRRNANYERKFAARRGA